MNQYKKLSLFVVFAIGLCVFYGLSQYFKPAKDHGDQPVEMTLTATELFEAFSSDDYDGMLEFGQVIVVQGKVQSFSKTSLVIQPGISCSMAVPLTPEPNWTGSDVEVKGRLVGFDDLFGEVQLDFVSFVDS